MLKSNALLSLVLIVLAVTSHADDEYHRWSARRYSAVAIDKRISPPTYHFAKDVPPAKGEGVDPAALAWRRATNKCGGISSRCYVLQSWGRHGCLGIFQGRGRDSGNIWTGYALQQQHTLQGSGSNWYLAEQAEESAENICNYHAYYDGKGPIYNNEIRYRRVCWHYDTYCSDGLSDEEQRGR